MIVSVQDENVPLLPGKTTSYGWRSLDRLGGPGEDVQEES